MEELEKCENCGAEIPEADLIYLAFDYKFYLAFGYQYFCSHSCVEEYTNLKNAQKEA